MVANFTWNPGNEYDIIASHSLWNGKEVDKVIPKPSVKFTLLRDPVHAFESGFIYMGLGTDINKYAQEVQNKRYPSRVPKGMKIILNFGHTFGHSAKAKTLLTRMNL